MWRESSECGMARKYIYSRTFSDHSRSFSIYSQTILDRSRSILEHSRTIIEPVQILLDLNIDTFPLDLSDTVSVSIHHFSC